MTPPDAQARVSLVTATFNRADYLPDLYASLVGQGTSVVEWIVVDDGSTDSTAQVLASLAAVSPFPVRVLKQSNLGKHAAVNAGVAAAVGEFVGIIDSDDLLTAGALSQLLRSWDSLDQPTREKAIGVTGRCVDDSGRVVGPAGREVVCTWQEAHYSRRLTGERWGIQLRDKLIQFPFPTEPAERFVGESVVWRRIGARYVTSYIETPVRTYREVPGQRLTTVDFASVAHARRVSHATVLETDLAYFTSAPWAFVRSAVQWNRGLAHEGLPFLPEARRLPLGGRLLVLLSWAPGRILAGVDRRRM